MLVHGEKEKMYAFVKNNFYQIREFLKSKIESDFKIKCFAPPNGATITIDTSPKMEINVSQNLLKRTLTQPLKGNFIFQKIISK